MRRALPFFFALSSLAFGFGAAAWLSSEARAAVEQLLLEQVRGAGAVVQALRPEGLADGVALERLRASGDFDEVSLVQGNQVLADGTQTPPHGIDLLRFDAQKLASAQSGTCKRSARKPTRPLQCWMLNTVPTCRTACSTRFLSNP